MSKKRERSCPEDLPDAVLMERYARGDATAFDELFYRYESRGYAFFSRRTASHERAQDLYQELFLRVHAARHTYDAGRPFAPWFFQIARRLLIDDQRRAFRTREIFSLESLPPRAASVESSHAAADREQLLRLLASLSETERFVVLSAKGEGVGYAELAAQLGKSVDAVKKIGSRALRRLHHGATSGLGPSLPRR